jgi:uncharacterized SAM-binding protein YcdF (DUF218 family)
MNQSSQNNRKVWVLALSILLAAALTACWAYRVSVLQGAAAYWIVSDPEGSADAVAVLGGGVETCPFAAADYYRNGLAHKSLVSNVRVRKVGTLGVSPLQADLNRAVLIKLGVPANDIELLGQELSNTYEEALALRECALLNNARSIIVPTESFPSRRVRWIFNREFAGLRTFVRIAA